jgi:hypothetical protein
MHKFSKSIINLLYYLIQFIEKIEFRNYSLDQDDISKKILFSNSVKGLRVKSDKGYVDVSHIHQTQPFNVWRLELENGYSLECADKHILFTPQYKEIFLKDLSIGSEIITDSGISKIVKLYKRGYCVSMGDLSIDSPDHRYYTNGILSHNTISASIMILHTITFKNEQGVLITADKRDTAIEVLDKLKDIYILLPFFLKRGIKAWNQRSLSFDNKSRIKTSGRTKSGIRGFAVSLLYMDEFAWIPSNILNPFYLSTFPTVSAIENSKIIITSTPNGFNLFHKILTEAELEDDDPGKNTFKALRVYWNQVPGRNVTYIRLNEHKIGQKYLDIDSIYQQIKQIWDPLDEFNANRLPYVKKWYDYENSKHVINVLNDRVDVDEIRKTIIINRNGEEVLLAEIGQISTWKEETIKDIGGIQAFNQEYDLRFISGADCILSEPVMERLLEIKEDFSHQSHNIFSDKLKWNYQNLRWTKDTTLFTEENRKKYKIIISIDISEGLGEDYSVINIFRIMEKDNNLIQKKKHLYTKHTDFFKLKQIGLFRSNLVSVEQLAEIAYLLGFEYFDEDNTKIVFEYNNDGKTFKTVIPKVFDQNNNYSSGIMFRFKHRIDAMQEEIGLRVSQNKNHFVKDYVDFIENGDIEVSEENTIKEITTFIKHQTTAGNTQYRADGSSKDDIVMTIVNVTQVFKKNGYIDLVETYFNEMEDIEFKKMVNEHLDKTEKTEGTDYAAFFSAKNNLYKYKGGLPNPFKR